MPTRSSAHTPNSSGDTLASPDGGSAICNGHSELDRIAQQRIWNDTDQDRDRPDLISLLLQHTQEAPDAPAVVDDQHTLTYAQLVAHATSVAHSLQKQGIDAGQSVGISLPRSAEMVVGIVATLLAGGSFVPLDPSWPQARRESVIHDASLSFVLTRDNCVLTDDALFDLDVTRELFTPPAMESVAYVIFTSGSTGRPKGAMIRHGAIVERLLWQRDQILFFGRDDASLFKAPLAFDISINEIFLPLVCGGRVVVAAPGVEQDPQRLAHLIHREGVTFAYLVSSVLDVMLKQAEGTNLLDSLRHVWCGGEMLTQALFRRFRQQLAIPLYHGYGPAEATIGVSHVIYRDDEDRLNTSIGVANPNCQLYVLDEQLRVVPHQEIGELYVAGFLLAKGYINAPGLTASRFVANVFASDGTRMYRTGDLVRRHNDGTLEFVGRADNQVKIRGMRLELEDVESALVGHPDVEVASVIAREGRLLGYVTVTAGLDGAAIRGWCAEKLPEYMVPAIITVMDELPRTANGKVDRKALPEPDWNSLTDAPADAERDGKTVALIAEAMAEALEVSALGAETDFFDIGGDSLRAITLVSALGRRGVEVSVGDIFSARTPQQLAHCAEEREAFAHDPDDEPTGEVHSLPILRWFDAITQHVDGFIQSVEFSVPEDVDEQLAGRMLGELLQVHPALRARVHQNPLHLEIPEKPAEGGVPIRPTTDIDALSSLLDPPHGVVVAAGLEPGRLRLVVHHLVVDGVSWNIIGEDLAAAYRGEQLAPERTSLRRWAQLLQLAVDTGEFVEDSNSSLPPLPSADEPLRDPQVPALADIPENAPTVREERSLVHEASVQITGELLGAVPRAFRTGANSVLLTALSVALARWRLEKQTWTLVEMEGHGRETRFVPGAQGREADLSRTVGWFTCLYPMLIDPTRAVLQEDSAAAGGNIAPLALALNAVKDQLAAIPGNGVPYQAHTWLHQSSKIPPQAQVLFNYLGRVSAGAHDFAPAGSTGQLGEQRDPDQPLVRELEFNAIAEDTGEGYVLRTTISWARGRISTERIDELVAHWDKALREVATLADHGVLSLGDVAPAPVNTADLARITAQGSAELQDVLPLTSLQHGMYFHSLFEESASSYVEQQVLRVECNEPFDRERFARAARLLIRRHPALSARPWETDGGDVVAVIDPGIAEHLQVNFQEATVPAELAEPELARAGLEGWLMQHAEEIAADDLSQGICLRPLGDALPEPLMRWTVVTPTSADGEVHGQYIAVIQTVHHLIADGWSVPIMLRDLLEIYRDDDAQIPRYDPQAGIAGSVRWVARRDKEADLSVWREEMREVRPTVLCPNPTSSLERRELLVDDPRTIDVPERARAAGVGLPDVVHAAWGMVLRALAGCEPGADVVFATSVSGRDIPVPGVTEAVGMQLNTIPVIAPGQSDPTLPVTSMLRAMVHHNNQVRDVQHVSLADIARDLGTNASELLDTLMVVEVPLSPQDLGCPGSPLQVVDVRNNGAPHFPLSIVVNPSAEYPLRLIYDPLRITEVRAQRIAQMLAASVDCLLSESGAVATVGEVAEALGAVPGVESGATTSVGFAADTLPSLWRRSFEHFSDRPALTSIGEDGASEHWTYQELDDAARRIRALLDQKVSTHTPRVALLMERDAWQIAAILAITMSAGTYVPVDPLSPQARVELILEDCQPDAVLVSPNAEKMVSELVSCPVLVLSEQTMNGEAKPIADRSVSVARDNDIAYVIYTSGSTGRPKGVAVTHANVTAMLRNARNHVEVSEEDVWSISHSFAFDFAVWEMWAALSSGGRAVVMPYALMRSPEDAAGVLSAEGVSMLSQTPTAFAALEPHLGQDSAVRTVIFGGEALEARAAATYCSAHSNIRFINMYGITETTVHVTAHECSENSGEARSPIGRPMDGVRTYVLDARLQPVQAGETGMIYVAGPQVTAGYWGLASTTASRFVADPFVGGGARMYCSNDMAKVLNNGHLDYVGRADRQVQLRGYRVELGEIEGALEKVSGVREAAVVVVDLPEGQVPGALLIADSGADAKEITSRAATAARNALPAYMIPQLFAVSTQVPQTINGKRDEDAILDLLGEVPTARKISGTSDLVEVISRAIADALCLDRAEVESDSDFFRLGGDSILAIRVTHALSRADLSVTPRDFFLGRTPRKIAERVTTQASQKNIRETEQSQEEALPKNEHAEISGTFPVPAMLRRQMERGMSDRFVQARRLDLGPVVVEDLERALQQVVQAHPMLRASVDTSSAFTRFVGVEGDGPMVVRTLGVDELIDHIDIAAGCSVVLGCVDGYVKAVAHHAVIDSASWMILEDDLRDALAGRRILPEHESYRDLCLQELYDAHTAAAQDVQHWSELAALPRPVEGSNQWSTDHVSKLEVSIDGQTAQVLQSVAPEVMGVDVQDLVTGLVTVAVARAMGTDARSWAVDVEGHGRPSDHSYSRTLGWFTTIAPVELPLADPADAARAAAEMRALHEEGAAPDRRTYQALRYTHPQGQRTLSHGAQILVNYLGRGETGTVIHAPGDATCQWTNYLVEADVWSSERAVSMDLSVANSVIPVQRLRSAIGEVARELQEHVSREQTSGRSAPLSVLQRGIWFQSQVAAPGAYVAQTVLTFDRRLDADAVVEAFRDTVTMHPAMGAAFHTDASGQPMQILPWNGQDIDFPVETIDGDLEEIMSADRSSGIDLASVPLAKATIVSGRSAEQPGDTLLLTYHLVLVDGWSRAVMLQTFLERLSLRSGLANRQGAGELAPRGWSIADVLLESVDTQKEQADSDYWVHRLEKLPQPTLVAPQAAEISSEHPGNELPLQMFAEVSEELTGALQEKIRAQAVTLTSVANSAVAVALGAITGDSDVVFGQSVSGRDVLSDPGMADVVGVLLNTVPVRVTARPGQSIEELVQDVHRQRIEDMDHDSADLGAIQQQLGVGTLFDSMVVVQNFLDPQAAAELRERHGVVEERAEDSTHFPLTWVFTPGPKLAIKLEFRHDVIDESLAHSVLKAATEVLTAFVDKPDIPLAQLFQLAPAHAVHSAWQCSTAQVASWQKAEGIDRTIADELLDTARLFPDRIAVVDDAQQWTFGELMARCSDIAEKIKNCGVNSGDTVAIAVERSAHSVAALLGALWAGVRYVPLDLTHPDGRLRVVVEDSQPAAALVDSGSRERMERIGAFPCVDVTTADSYAATHTPVAMPGDVAYLMYTSGSTGKPKGVVITHRGLHNMLDNHRRKIFAPAAADGRTLRIAHAVSFAFDMSWEELFWLVEGHEVRILSEDLRRDAAAMVQAIRAHQVDVINVTPTVAEQLFAEGMLESDTHRPRLVLLGGEAVSHRVWETLQNADAVRGYNLYGPTEYTINALGAGTEESPTPVIGTPVDRTAAFVLDPWLRPVLAGTPGELYLAGSGLAQEYHGLAARTASSMVACPWGAPGERMYRTGDIVRVRSDGMFEYLGRSDDQVKIHGHRVDPGDVSAVVSRGLDPRILHCVTIPVRISDATLLACHLVAPQLLDADQGERQSFLTGVRNALREELPSYMIPDRWSIVGELPMTSNGKTDLAALGEGERIREKGREPASEAEEITAELFAESLDIEPKDVPADADYFDMGGHSMAVIKLCALLRGELGVEVGVREFYGLRTVERVAEYVQARS